MSVENVHSTQTYYNIITNFPVHKINNSFVH